VQGRPTRRMSTSEFGSERPVAFEPKRTALAVANIT